MPNNVKMAVRPSMQLPLSGISSHRNGSYYKQWAINPQLIQGTLLTSK